MQLTPTNLGPVTNASGTVGTTAVSPFTISSGQTYVFIQNISTVDMYVGIGFTPTTSSGILIKPSGSLEYTGTFVPTGVYNIIAASGTNNPYTAIYG